MNEIMIMLGWVGIYSPMALGALGSTMGTAIAGQTACGALLDVESGYGRYIGLTAMPSSQVVYGIVVMFTLQRTVTAEVGGALGALGLLAGLALMLSGYYQGKCIASAINASKSKPEVFGLSIAPAAIIEGFAVFAFVFVLVLAGSLPAE